MTGLSLSLAPFLTFLLALPPISISLQHLHILQAFSLLLLGASLSTLATLNFSLAFLIGLLASPLNFARPLPRPTTPMRISIVVVAALAHAALSPPAILQGVTRYFGQDLGAVLLEMARGWQAQGVWTGLVVWGVWWPAWVVSGVVLFGGIVVER